MEPSNWQFCAWIITTLIGSLGAAVALWRAQQSYVQRVKEHRWRQMEVGKRLVDDMFHDEPAHRAARIMDELKKSIELSDGSRHSVKIDDVIGLLSHPNKERDEKEDLLLFCFDSFIYHWDRFEYFIHSDLVTFEDVQVPAEYYVDLIVANQKLRNAFASYIRTIGYQRAKRFLNRFSAWRSCSPNTEASD